MAQRTVLYDRHRGAGARMVDFAGWEMPVSYAGALEEHRAVRERCGLFDVSHMGEVEVRGPGALACCERLTVNAVGRLHDGVAQYSVLCDERGGVIDDLLVYRLASERYLLVVNASNTETDVAWIREHAPADAEIIDRSAETALLALQGPTAFAVLESLARPAVANLPSFGAMEAAIAGVRVLVSRTGYTGEDGVEIFVDASRAAELWDALVAAMTPLGGVPCGLAARDTLRLEAALPLCGSDMDRTTTPLEAGLGWVVKLDKGDFIGHAALAAQRASGIPRALVGVEMDEPGIPRHGHLVVRGGRVVGAVTSGTKSPTLGTFVGLASVERESAALGTRLEVEIRQRRLPAHVVARPFYRRTK